MRVYPGAEAGSNHYDRLRRLVALNRRTAAGVISRAFNQAVELSTYCTLYS